MTRDGQAAQPAGRPALEVVAGHPSPDELAALTVTLAAVLAARDRAAGRAGQAGRAASRWASRSRLPGAPLRPGPDAWRRSAWPAGL
jgi:acyl-CoA carboxylase epsilon subunit